MLGTSAVLACVPAFAVRAVLRKLFCSRWVGRNRELTDAIATVFAGAKLKQMSHPLHDEPTHSGTQKC